MAAAEPTQARSAPRSAFLVAEHNARYVWHPMVDPKVSETTPPLVIERGEGVHFGGMSEAGQ